MPKAHASFFKLLSSRTRVQILNLLFEHDDLTVDDLACRLDVSVPTVSRHLQLMRVQDLVTFRQDAQTRYYQVNENEIAERIGTFLKDLGIELTDA
jgi:DNA-binding transcriptional ArsR family regulator